MLSVQDQREGKGEERNAHSARLEMATRGCQSMRLANPKCHLLWPGESLASQEIETIEG